MDKVTRAKLYAQIAHTGQVYSEEVPYTVHLQQVVDVLGRFNVDSDDMICAAWLHDTIEDTRISYNDISTRFGVPVAELVYAVTNELGRNRKERTAKTYPKIRENPDAVTLKLADRIANVEYGIANGGKADMYRTEYPDFRAGLHSDQHRDNPVLCRLWAYLDILLGAKT